MGNWSLAELSKKGKKGKGRDTVLKREGEAAGDRRGWL
jgi:hypothetical protein